MFGRSLGRPARLVAASAAAATGSLGVLAWLWPVSPFIALLATVLFGGFLAGEFLRLRLAREVPDLRADATGNLMAVGAGGLEQRTVRVPVVMPWLVCGRLGGGPVAVTPASAGPEAFRRLVVALREAARRVPADAVVASPQAR